MEEFDGPIVYEDDEAEEVLGDEDVKEEDA